MNTGSYCSVSKACGQNSMGGHSICRQGPQGFPRSVFFHHECLPDLRLFLLKWILDSAVRQKELSCLPKKNPLVSGLLGLRF